VDSLIFDDSVLGIYIRSSYRRTKHENTHTHPQNFKSKGGMHPPEIFQTHHVFNVLIGKEQSERMKKK